MAGSVHRISLWLAGGAVLLGTLSLTTGLIGLISVRVRRTR